MANSSAPRCGIFTPRTARSWWIFAGWEMPVQYRSILEEHKAVRRRRGPLRREPHGRGRRAGARAPRVPERPRDQRRRQDVPGRVLYSPMCHPDGGVIDDLLVYMRGPGRLFPVHQRRQHGRRTSRGSGAAAGLRRDRDGPLGEWALLAVQGPRRAGIVQSLTGRQARAHQVLPFCEGTVAGVPA
jgi:aminomethyltransferase